MSTSHVLHFPSGPGPFELGVDAEQHVTPPCELIGWILCQGRLRWGMRVPAVGRAQEVGGESMALGRVAVAQLHNMGDGEEADEVHQHLETMTCGRIIIFFF